MPPREIKANCGGVPLLQQLKIEKLVVFRALQLGDMLCAVPALRALRTALPCARITLAGLPWAEQFAFRFRHYIDDFAAFPGHPAFPEQSVQEGHIPGFYCAMRARRFDLALQMHGSGEISNRVAHAFGARLLAGFVPGESAHHDSRRFLHYPKDGAEPLRLLRLVQHLGACAGTAALEFPITEEDREALRASRLTERLDNRGYFCVHPGARHRGKCWPLPCFAQVADALAEEYGLQPVLTGSPQETDLTATLAASMRTPALDTAGPLPIGAMAALVQGARLLVCNDTGVSHIAAGLKLPSVVVFSSADIRRWAPLDRELHRCLRDPEGIGAQAVLTQARALLDRFALSAGSEQGQRQRDHFVH